MLKGHASFGDRTIADLAEDWARRIGLLHNLRHFADVAYYAAKSGREAARTSTRVARTISAWY